MSATLRSISDHAYFFIEDGADVSDADLERAVQAFEDEIWLAVTGAFGEPELGIDGDPRITILHADLGPAVAGYVTEEDAFPEEAVPHSHQREMVYMNVNTDPGSASYTHVLAHELQHVIHRNHDLDEESWVNEGLSEVAAGLVGGGESFTSSFLDEPDTQLTGWALLDSSTPHYGAAGLFFSYLLEQASGGPGAVAAVAENSLAGVAAFLTSAGEAREVEDFVADWAVANFLDQSSGPYGYAGRDVREPKTAAVSGPGEATVHQFGADYLEIDADEVAGPATLVFEGDTEVAIVGVPEDDGGGFWYSGRGDNIDSRLTREVDLSDTTTATLTFRTWYDIERWYDYAYVAVSGDGGATWTALAGRHTITEDPVAVAYGPGYGGQSEGWVEERVDLSAFAGQVILLRFEYVTDDSSNAGGWAIDDIAVPEAGFLDRGETDAGAWQREGFRRVATPLPQRFELRLITFGTAPTVEEIAVDGQNRAKVPLAGLGGAYRRAVLVVMATTDGTLEPAGYRYSFTFP